MSTHRRRQSSRTARNLVLIGALLGAIAACGGRGGDRLPLDSVSQPISGVAGPTGVLTPIGLALEVDGGVGVPLQVRAGQTFFLNQIDLRVSIPASIDEGVAGLAKSGDFESLDWKGIKLVDEEPILLSNADGTFTRRRFFRGARWMNEGGTFELQQLDASGGVVGAGLHVDSGVDDARRPTDSFFVRRYRAIQWTNDCVGLHDCTGAKSFSEEALVELRNALSDTETFRIRPTTTALRLTWSRKPTSPWIIPVTQVSAPTYDYGFSIDLKALTPPGAGGVYAPGSDIRFQITLRDGAGHRLHPEGELPSYNEVIFGPNPAGIEYYRAFFDETTTYYRRKHRERMLMSQIIGPAQSIQPIRSVIELADFLGPDEVQTVGTPVRDGVHSQFITFPPAPDLFGGAFDPTHAGWAKPVKDSWIYHLPADAAPGTYLVTVKGRRVYLGQDIPFTRTIEVQVGTMLHTTAVLPTGPCNSCHSGNAALGTVLHANDNRAACSGCHVPLGFELEGPIYVRTHFLHSRSHRLDAPVAKCANCHLDESSVQRTSKSACLSCHTSYPKSHVAKYGPIESMYIGGGRESFNQCSTSCHTTHPESGFGCTKDGEHDH